MLVTCQGPHMGSRWGQVVLRRHHCRHPHYLLSQCPAQGSPPRGRDNIYWWCHEKICHTSSCQPSPPPSSSTSNSQFWFVSSSMGFSWPKLVNASLACGLKTNFEALIVSEDNFYLWFLVFQNISPVAHIFVSSYHLCQQPETSVSAQLAFFFQDKTELTAILMTLGANMDLSNFYVVAIQLKPILDIDRFHRIQAHIHRLQSCSCPKVVACCCFQGWVQDLSAEVDSRALLVLGRSNTVTGAWLASLFRSFINY